MQPGNPTIPYGAEVLSIDAEGLRLLGVLDVADGPGFDDSPEHIDRVLRNPIGLERSIFDSVRGGESVVIVVSDSFRKTGIHRILPPLIDGLASSGIRASDISFLFATGVHRAPTPKEQRAILGAAIFDSFGAQSFVHDATDAATLEHLGDTSSGTPVFINRRALVCDRLIVTGTAVLHYFAGFGGGPKAVVPGLAGLETIARNHALNLDPEKDRLDPRVRIGVMEGNPVSMDQMEGARMVKVDYLINTVLDRRGNIAGLFAGDLVKAHLEATEYARTLFTAEIEERADIVIAAAPETADFVQTHKALFNADMAAKPAGRIILAAPCPEGLGSEQFVKWLRLGSTASIIEELRKHAEINGQTALSTLARAPKTTFLTELDETEVASLGGRKARTLAEALTDCIQELRAEGITHPSCWVMPNATYTVPVSQASSPTPAQV